jgi:hypothetical protein
MRMIRSRDWPHTLADAIDARIIHWDGRSRGVSYAFPGEDWMMRPLGTEDRAALARLERAGLSITMEAAFCVETLVDAMAHHGKPENFNTDQGSQFTGSAFTGVLADNDIAISMDGKALGETTSSSSGCGAASSTRRCISEPTTTCPRHAPRLGADAENLFRQPGPPQIDPTARVWG